MYCNIWDVDHSVYQLSNQSAVDISKFYQYFLRSTNYDQLYTYTYSYHLIDQPYDNNNSKLI